LLRSNPLGLERFSREEKVQIELLQLLKDLKVPLKAFSLTLNWAAKSNERGHFFKVGCQPSHEKVIKNLYQMYNMNGLIPKKKQLYLPYSKRTVSMVYFNASAVFASLLSCSALIQDESFLFMTGRIRLLSLPNLMMLATSLPAVVTGLRHPDHPLRMHVS
jgi:hypothetical protein